MMYLRWQLPSPRFPRARVHQNAPPNRVLSARGPPFRLIIGLRAKSITPSIRGADLFGPMIGETDDLANFSAVADARDGKKQPAGKLSITFEHASSSVFLLNASRTGWDSSI